MYSRSLWFVYLLTILLSDLLFSAVEEWDVYKAKTISQMKFIPGWCDPDKALWMMDFIKEQQCQICVEIGVFAGASSFPIMRALKYQKSGTLYAVDAWDSLEAIKEFDSSDPNRDWWNNIDFQSIKTSFLHLIHLYNLKNYCQIIHQPSQEAVHLFEDETIDFIHIDGNHQESMFLKDVKTYFPKIKDGGYILLNDANWLSARWAFIFLCERAHVVFATPHFSYVVFKKDNNLAETANDVFQSSFINHH